MSLYNLLFGHNSMAPVLLSVLGLNPAASIPRFRDCWLDAEHRTIVVYTRTGGGNRRFYDCLEACKANYPEYFGDDKEEPMGPWNGDLRKHPHYVRDEDDDFDSTYAQFHFSFPDDFVKELTALCESGKVETIKPGERWQKIIKDLEQRTKP